MSLDELNHIADLLAEIEDEPIYPILDELLGYYSSLEEIVDHKNDIICYLDCENMEDVAYYLVDECGMLDGAPDIAYRYFDYSAYGRDLEIEGSFILSTHGVFEIPY